MTLVTDDNSTQEFTENRRRARRVVQVFLLCSLFAIATVAGIWIGRTRQVASRNNGFLEVDPGRLDFGEACVQERFEMKVPITNTWREDIEIVRFVPSCGCVSVEPKSVKIPRGQSVEIKVVVDLTTDVAERRSLHYRRFSATIVPITRRRLRPAAEWKIHGRVRVPFYSVQPILDFADTLVAGQPFAPKAFNVVSHEPKLGLTAVCDKKSVAVLSLEKLSPDGRRHRVIVQPEGSLPVGRHDFSVLLMPAAGQGAEVPPMRLPVRQQVMSEFQLVPSNLPLGALNIGEIKMETVSLISRSGREFDIVNMTDDSDSGTHVERMAETLSGELKDLCLNVRQEGRKPGFQSRDIRIVVQSKDGERRETLHLTITYYGFADSQDSPTDEDSEDDIVPRS